jgi:hypothetical protein
VNIPKQSKLDQLIDLSNSLWLKTYALFIEIWKEYRTEIVVVIIGFVLMNAIFVSSAFRNGSSIDPTTAGQFGDFVGGYIGTAFTLISVVLLFATLKNQRNAAQEQNFETKYFELIKMHRDNVSELELQNAKGRKIFVSLMREFRSILCVTRRVGLECQQNLSQQQLLHIAYYCLFYGTGPNSSRMLKMSLAEFDNNFVSMLESELNKDEAKENVRADRKLCYVPFEGHQSRLGHYYRHLYQTVCYVDKQKLLLDKYEYVKTIRAQLTTHEQALLLLNSLAPIGNDWWKKGLIVKYRMVQNLPRDFFDPEDEFNVSKIFDCGYFEWEEVQQER